VCMTKNKEPEKPNPHQKIPNPRAWCSLGETLL